MSVFDEAARLPISIAGERYWNYLAEIAVKHPTNAEIMYLHMLFAQTGMPHKEHPFGQPYQRRNGSVSLGLTPGYLMNPATGKLELQGLPYGPIPRLIMLYICNEAKRTESPRIDMNRTLTSFCREDLEISTSGGVRGGLTSFKRQMNYVAATNMVIGMSYLQSNGGTGVRTVRPTPAILECRVWDENSQRNKPMWNTEVLLSPEFFKGVVESGMPLDNRAIKALRSSSLALDMYFNMAQRLPRIEAGQVFTMTWKMFKDQFFSDGMELKKVKFETMRVLDRVKGVYPEMKMTDVPDGIEFRQSKPPVIPDKSRVTRRQRIIHKSCGNLPLFS